MKQKSWFVVLLLSPFFLWQQQSTLLACQAFSLRLISPQRQQRRPETSFTALDMGKGFQSAKNKQAELVRKMQQAKQQQQQQKVDQENASDAINKQDKDTAATNKSKSQTKKDHDDMHTEFRKLLASNLPPPEPASSTNVPTLARPQKPKTPATPAAGGGPKVAARDLKRKRKRQQANSELDKSNKESETEQEPIVVLQVGDKGRRRDFEKLVQPMTLQPLGPLQAAQLVPWVPPYLTDYLIVVADPRRQSNDLRATLQYIVNDESAALLSATVKILAVTADEAQELVAWQKRSGLDDLLNDQDNDMFLTMVVDPSLEWMHTYACVDQENPW